jgi:hypothetical protein
MSREKFRYIAQFPAQRPLFLIAAELIDFVSARKILEIFKISSYSSPLPQLRPFHKIQAFASLVKP